MKSARKVIAFPSARPDGNEREFLPAALEIVETPASPAGRALAYLIVAIFSLSLLWAALAKVDIVASSTGKVVLAGGTKLIQPLETGIVRAIHVHDGQKVAAGDLLVELDPGINAEERAHSAADLTAARLEIARLKAALAPGDDPLASFDPPADAAAAEIAAQRQYLLQQTAEFKAKVEAIDRQRDQKIAERGTIQATINKLLAMIPIVQQRVDIRKVSSEREYTSRFQYLETYQSLVEAQQELLVQQSHLREAAASIEALAVARDQAVAEYHRTLLAQLTEAQRKADGLVHDVERIQHKIDAQSLTAPISGTVQQLAIHTVGGVVTPAQNLLVVVPGEGRLEIEAMVLNRDIGFVEPGQAAEIKVDTFNFTRYGLLHGTVLSISHDAVVHDKRPDLTTDKAPGAETTSSEPHGQELSFPARISLDRTQMQIDGKEIGLTPGMAVTVEIKTGARSVMSYLLSPLLRLGHDSLKER